MKLSIIIPAYNESDNIKATINEVLSVMDKAAETDKVEIIVADDHSSDNTFETVQQINDSRVSCIRLSKRSGSHTAIRAGFREATGDTVMFMDADGQVDPSCIPEMLKKWHNGAKVVWALRRSRKHEAKRISIPATLFYRIMTWLGDYEDNPIDLSDADFWLFDRVAVDAFNSCVEKNTSISGLVTWLGFKQDFIEYDRRTRRHGKSKWTFRTRFRSAKDWIVAFSGLPLKLMVMVGFFIAIIGFLYALYIIFNYFTGSPVGGWSTIMVAILLLGGIQMIMLGIIGEYLWRNLEESRKRPLYFIEKNTLNKGN